MWDTFYYGVCYYPEAWDRSIRADDIRRMKKAGFNVVRMGEGAWSYWEPREGEYQFELFDEVIDLCRKYDIKVIMGTPTYAAPAWVSHKYPEVLRSDFNRIPMKHGGRRNLNYTSPKYIELSNKLCTALAKHYKNEKQIIGWQLDNEFNCHMDVSYAESDTIAFRRWCREKYKTLDRLNKAWGTSFWSQTYTDWDQIDLPHPTAAYMNPHRILDETRFISDCVVCFAERQAAILRRHQPRWFVTHNCLFGNINPPHLAAVCDFWSHDQYPLFYGPWWDHARRLIESRAMSFPFAILEHQSGPGGQMAYLQRTPRPGEMRRWCWQSIAHGASGLLFFRWRTCPFGSEQHWHGLLEPHNRDNRRLAEATQLGREIRRLPKAFLTAAPVKAVAVLREFENEANDRRINTWNKEGHWEAHRFVGEFHRQHVPADMVWETADFTGYKLLIAPHLQMITPALAAKLRAYVQRGGTLVLGAQTGTMTTDLHLLNQPGPGPLRSLAGVEVEDWTTLPEGEGCTAVFGDGGSVTLNTFVERLTLKGAKPLATWDGSDPLLDSTPAITLRKVGKGQVIYIAGYALYDGVIALLPRLMKLARIKPIAHATDKVEILDRRAGKTRYIILINYADTAELVTGLPKGKDLLTGKPIKDGSVTLKKLDVVVLEAGR